MKVNAQDSISFPSLDGLEISADLYHISDHAPVILLCHQARFSRGEYNEIAAKLNKMGFNCIAIDQRSGDEVNGVKNETAARAKEGKLGTTYLHAEVDIKAGIEYAYRKYNQKIILWGSSYSASLALKQALENDHVLAAVAFSPGEYFNEQLNLKNSIKGLDKALFVTSSKEEAPKVKELVEVVHAKELKHFIPTGAGIHGSKALWESTEGHEEYWKALKIFLSNFVGE